MILLDHNIPESQAEYLRLLRIHFLQIGHDAGRPEWDDQQELLRHLQASKQTTFFTRDLGFFRRNLCHLNYCLVVLAVPALESAIYIRRLLKHPEFRTRSQRQGKVIKLSAEKIVMWRVSKERIISIEWS